MNSVLVVALALALVSTAYAACPNGCSGHGSCGNDDICQCYVDYLNGDEEGGDCSERKCPFAQAWADAPSAPGVAHAMAECAGRGICDRSTGDCDCFEGFTGKGCTRTTCPNDCSGHGTCEYIEELDAMYGDMHKLTGDSSTKNRYKHQFTDLWDAHKTRACQCDPKWTELDCSRRMCPRGNYALYNDAQPTSEVQRIIIDAGWGDDTAGDRRGFALTFLSTLHEEFTTGPIILAYVDAAAKVYDLHGLMTTTPGEFITSTATLAKKWMVDSIEYELDNLPNKVIQDIEVDVKDMASATAYGPGTFVKGVSLEISITFNGASTTGDQYLLECRTQNGGAGTQPLLGNTAYRTYANGAGALNAYGRVALSEKGAGSAVVGCRVDSVFAAVAAAPAAGAAALNIGAPAKAANLECSGRGKCQYDTGVCACFEGYTDEYCSTQTALI